MPTHTLDEEVFFITHPLKWPRMMLPVVNRLDSSWERRTGLILEPDFTTVYEGNLWDESFDPESAKKYQYSSTRALVEAGWRVD